MSIIWFFFATIFDQKNLELYSMCAYGNLLSVVFSAEYNYYNTGLIPSKFYGSLTSRDNGAFKESLYQSLIIVASACVVS